MVIQLVFALVLVLFPVKVVGLVELVQVQVLVRVVVAVALLSQSFCKAFGVTQLVLFLQLKQRLFNISFFRLIKRLESSNPVE